MSVARVPVLLLSAAGVISALGYAGYIFGSWLTAGRLLLVLPPILIAAASALLLSRHRGTRAPLWLFVGLVSISAVSVQFFGVSFSSGMDAADAGRRVGLLGQLTLPFGILGTISSGAAVGLLLGVTVLRRRPPMQRGVLAVLAGSLAGLPLFVLQFNPLYVAILSFVVLVVLLFPRSRPKKAVRSHPVEVPAVSPKILPALGALSLGILLTVWCIGAWVGFSEAGNPEATTAMGLAAGAAPLAALPLIPAAALVGRTRSSKGQRLSASFLPIMGITAGCVIQVAGYSIDGSALLMGVAIAGASVGSWLAVMTDSPESTWLIRIAVAGAVIVGGTLVWFFAVAMTGGVLLAAPAILLILTGRSLSRPVSIA